MAFRCYQKGGFEHIHEKYLGGAAGPQFIMRSKTVFKTLSGFRGLFFVILIVGLVVMTR